MANGKSTPETLSIEVGSELLERIGLEARRLGIDISTFINWCILAGLYLDGCSLFIRSRDDENTFDEMP